jgi:hypothetical protein
MQTLRQLCLRTDDPGGRTIVLQPQCPRPSYLRRSTRAALFAALLATSIGGLCLSAPVAAALYKWTDASGRVVYSDQPPNGDFKVETVNAPPPPANPNAVKEMAAKEAELKKRKLESQEATKKTDLERADADKRAVVCRDAQAQIKQLSADQIQLMRLNEKGETVYMDDAERSSKRLELENWVRSNCPA